MAQTTLTADDVYKVSFYPTVKSLYFNLPQIDTKSTIERKDFKYVFPEDVSKSLEIELNHFKLMKFLRSLKNLDTMLKARRKKEESIINSLNIDLYDTSNLTWTSNDDFNNIIKGERRYVNKDRAKGFFTDKKGLFGIYIGRSANQNG